MTPAPGTAHLAAVTWQPSPLELDHPTRLHRAHCTGGATTGRPLTRVGVRPVGVRRTASGYQHSLEGFPGRNQVERRLVAGQRQAMGDPVLQVYVA